ncbi:MAG: deoxyribodipyrimidine photolyase [Calditrichaeota bacterium]|nr:deoxyribodipyrimidine photolyase [Calditrichota bacterium]
MTTSRTLRLCTKNHKPHRETGFVLYWMLAQRRVTHNFALGRAVQWAEHLKQPLVILESLTLVYDYASPRQHVFLLQGMRDNLERLQSKRVFYYPFVERIPGERMDLLQALADLASVVVVDDFPMPMHRSLIERAAADFPCKLESVDSCGLFPLRAAEVTFPTAFAFRRFLQRTLREHLESFPEPDPLQGAKLPRAELPKALTALWPQAEPEMLLKDQKWMNDLPLLHSVEPVETIGGTTAAEQQLSQFLDHKLEHYADERNQLEADYASGLSPYLHFGHISVHQVFGEVAKREGWKGEKLSSGVAGKKEGWWGMGKNSESFLDELITWREVGLNFNHLREDYDKFSSLPPWALKTLDEHRKDKRKWIYSTEELENAATHDPLWNAAQNQLRREGKIHNYLRMLWGKKILEWSASPEDALETMIELNDKWALDGRDPNSYSGILWCLGRYDRPWFPEREIFGQIRYMSSENTARKVKVKGYIEKYSNLHPDFRGGKGG